MLDNIKSISRKRTARILIDDNRYELRLIRKLSALVGALPTRIELLVVTRGTTVSGDADARLTLSGPLSESSLAEVKSQMVLLRQRVLIGSGWILESLRNDISATHDVRFMEE